MNKRLGLNIIDDCSLEKDVFDKVVTAAVEKHTSMLRDDVAISRYVSETNDYECKFRIDENGELHLFFEDNKIKVHDVTELWGSTAYYIFKTIDILEVKPCITN